MTIDAICFEFGNFSGDNNGFACCVMGGGA